MANLAARVGDGYLNSRRDILRILVVTLLFVLDLQLFSKLDAKLSISSCSIFLTRGSCGTTTQQEGEQHRTVVPLTELVCLSCEVRMAR